MKYLIAGARAADHVKPREQEQVILEEDRGVLDARVSPCGHRNPPSAHFCDACGVELPKQCPRCSASNSGQANFCSNCGMGLRDVPRTHATPSTVLFHASTDSSPTETQPPPAPLESLLAAKQAANGGMEGSDSDGRGPWTPQSAKERLRQIVNVAQQRRRRMWVRRGAVGASIAIGLLGAALVRTHSATPTAWRSPFIGVGVQERIAIPAGRSGSAAIAPPTLERAPDMTLPPDRHEDSAVPAAPEKSPAVALTRREPPSYDPGGAETFALIHPALHSNTLLRNARTPSAGDRHAGSVLSVAPDRLVVHEVGRAGEEQKLHVTITGKTRIIESRRNPVASGTQDAFTDQSISLAQIKQGDYVVVDASRQGTKLVAASITVTLRRETQLVGPDPHAPAPPTSAAAVAPRVEPQKQSAAPTARATTSAQPLAPHDTEDPNSIIEWLLYPAAGRSR